MPPSKPLKIVLVGDCSVGKTSTMNQFVNKKFTHEYQQTIGADFLTTEILLNDQLVTLQVWDMAGSEPFQDITFSFVTGAHCCILLYDVCDSRSFASLNTWREEVLMQLAPSDPLAFPFFVLGNKCDEDEKRKVSLKRASAWCMAKGQIKHFEISAKTGSSVTDAFRSIASAAIKYRKSLQPKAIPAQAPKLLLKQTSDAQPAPPPQHEPEQHLAVAVVDQPDDDDDDEDEDEDEEVDAPDDDEEKPKACVIM